MITILKNIVKKNRYLDSVFLMSVSQQIKKETGIKKISAMMGTKANKELLTQDELLTSDGREAGPNDLIIALLAEDDTSLSQAVEKLDYLLEKQEVILPQESKTYQIRNLQKALQISPDANLVFIAVPGQYVKWEAEKALESGCHVMIFSDNVPIEDELYLKQKAQEKGLLVMGPDCGTALINQKSLGFANKVSEGSIGIIGASGTGIQEACVLLDLEGLGVSQVIGTGGRDVSEAIGAITMKQAIKALDDDPATKLILIISKPPAPKVEKEVLNLIKECKKTFVINFLNGSYEEAQKRNIPSAKNIEEAVIKAAEFIKGKSYLKDLIKNQKDYFFKQAQQEWEKFKKSEKYIRGVFAGGTLCQEALLAIREFSTEPYSNTPLSGEYKLTDSRKSFVHSLIDLGDDEFTVGVPHPMLDNTMRAERIIQEARDSQTAILLFDIVLGYGVHSDPAGGLLPALEEARKIAEDDGRYISFISFICGTVGDPQDLSLQKAKLEKAGVLLLPTNVQAAYFATLIANKGEIA